MTLTIVLAIGLVWLAAVIWALISLHEATKGEDCCCGQYELSPAAPCWYNTDDLDRVLFIHEKDRCYPALEAT